MATQTKVILTPAQDRVLRVLADLIDEIGAPSLEEWADRGGPDGSRVTQASIMQHRKELAVKGMVINTPGKVRSLRLTKMGYKAIGRKAK